MNQHNWIIRNTRCGFSRGLCVSLFLGMEQWLTGVLSGNWQRFQRKTWKNKMLFISWIYLHLPICLKVDGNVPRLLFFWSLVFIQFLKIIGNGYEISVLRWIVRYIALVQRFTLHIMKINPNHILQWPAVTQSWFNYIQVTAVVLHGAAIKCFLYFLVFVTFLLSHCACTCQCACPIYSKQASSSSSSIRDHCSVVEVNLLCVFSRKPLYPEAFSCAFCCSHCSRERRLMSTFFFLETQHSTERQFSCGHYLCTWELWRGWVMVSLDFLKTYWFLTWNSSVEFQENKKRGGEKKSAFLLHRMKSLCREQTVDSGGNGWMNE